MSIFRKNALNALNTPEQLDQPMQLLRPTYWTLILGLSGFSLSLLIWSIFGRLPVRINGQGVLTRSESLQRIQSETAGRIAALTVQVGDCVSHRAALARIESTQQELEVQKVTTQLQLLLSQDVSEDLLSSIRQGELQQQLARVQGLASSGAISQDDIAQRQQQLTSTRLELAARNDQRHQQIQELRNQIRNLNQSIQSTAIVRAPRQGCVIDRQVKLGEVVQPGSTLFELESAGSGDSLQSLAFFAPGDGKRLKPGQRVQITPSSTKAQRHGRHRRADSADP